MRVYVLLSKKKKSRAAEIQFPDKIANDSSLLRSDTHRKR